MMKKGLAAAVVALIGLAAIVGISTLLLKREYKEPYRTPAGQAVEETPRDQGLADQRAAEEQRDKDKPYEEVE